MEDAGYEEAEDNEEAFEAEENPLVTEIRGAEKWHMCSMLESGYDLFHGWLVDEGVVWIYDRFIVHLVAQRATGGYPGPPVCHLRGW